MLIGAFGDVHGNSAALQEVWGALKSQGLTENVVLNTGDNVAYGDEPEAVVRFLTEHENIETVQGNYDRSVAQYPNRIERYKKQWGTTRPEKLSAIRQDSETISEWTRSWLLALPRSSRFTLGGHEVLLTHYSPVDKEGIGPWTDDESLARLASHTSASVVVCGHTHFPFTRRAAGVLFVNPGTVGRSVFTGPTYAILSLDPDTPPTASIVTLSEP